MSVQWKKFRSPNSFVRRVALLSGHVYQVGLEYQELPDFAWSEAYRVGCISEDMSVNRSIPPDLLKALSDEVEEMDMIREAILVAIQQNVHDAFKKDGTPNIRWLNNKLGTSLDKDLVAKVWFKLENE